MKTITRSEARNQNLTKYFTGKPCKYGHYSERATNNGICLECRVVLNATRVFSREYKDKANSKRRESYPERREVIAEWGKVYREINREKIKERTKKKYSECDKDEKKEIDRQYYLENKEKVKARVNARYHRETESIRQKQKEYYEKNKADILVTTTAYQREFRRTPIGKTTSFIRHSLRRVVRLLKQDKHINSMTSVGYTPLELKDHLEALFDVGMSWDNHGDWHIDHIVSLSVLVHRNRDLPQGELMLIVNRLDNLQPLWAGDNLRKGRY